MKKLFFALAATLLLSSACKKEDGVLPVKNFVPGEPVTLALNQSAILEPDQLKITFNKVTEDSRCPTNMECLWEGRAVVELTFTKGGESFTESLATISSMSGLSDMTMIFDREVKLLEVTPYPQNSASITAGDYRVKIVVN
jgi:hypothetical protein